LKKSKCLWSILAAVVVTAALGVTGIVLASTGVVGRVQDASVSVTDTLPPPRTVTIAAVGDIMMGTDYPATKLPPQNGALLFVDAAPILRAVDIAFGNLEGPITTARACTKNTSNPRTFAFRCPPKLASNLATAGFDVMSLANNHARDFGYAGMTETKKILDSLGIQYSSKQGEVAEFVIDSLKIGLIALSTGSSPRSILNIEMCRKEVEELAPRFDILIVSFHGGSEGTKALHTTYKFENLYGEPRGNVIEFAHTMIDAGADLVIGHGPHVPRGMEVYKDRLIAYSLGNFCTYRCMQLTGELGYAPLLVVEVDSIGNFLRGEVHSFCQFPPGGPTKDTTEAVFNLMRSLSIADFETSAPSFSKNLSFYPPADSGLSVEEIEAVRDSLDALSIVEPDTATPEVTESVDSFITVIQEEQDTSDVSDEDLPQTTSSAQVPSTPEDADSVAVPEPDSANRSEGE